MSTFYYELFFGKTHFTPSDWEGILNFLEWYVGLRGGWRILLQLEVGTIHYYLEVPLKLPLKTTLPSIMFAPIPIIPKLPDSALRFSPTLHFQVSLLMRLLGVKHYRFSLSWSRIIPNGTGEVNPKAISLYRDMISEMKKNGIKPYITMFHWEFPQALQDKGGWVNRELVEWFENYAKVVAENFSDLCEYFITFNEPQCFIGLGNLTGVHAPGLTLPIRDTFQMVHHMLMAHGKAALALRKYAPPSQAPSVI